MSLTQTLARFVAAMGPTRYPAAAAEVVKTGLIDCVAVMLAGSQTEVAEVVRRVVGIAGNGGEARIAFGREGASAPDAALVNGTAAHALDYDDVAMSAHPSAVLVPTILAEGEAVGATGPEIIAAYVTGYEVWAELAFRDPDPHHTKGWHPTAIFGVVGAAAAAARLRRLSAEQSAHALGLAASSAGGLVANFGTMTKPYHVGRAAQGGIMAARLAAAGMTAAADAFEHPLGFLAALSPKGRFEAGDAKTLGSTWQILRHGVNVKKYPTCYATHRSLDGMLDLVQAHGLKAEDIAGIEVEMGPTQATILRNHRPSTGLAAKFSEEFAMAAAVVAGRAGLAELSDDFVRRADVQALIPKVTTRTIAGTDPDDPVFSAHEFVTVRLTNGRTLRSPEIRHARGHAQLPIAPEALWAKFQDCAAYRFSAPGARALFAALSDIERLESLAALPVADRALGERRLAS